MMNEIRFFVGGIPQSGGSKTAFAIKKAGVYTGRSAMVEAGTKESRQRKRDWRAKVTLAAGVAANEANEANITGLENPFPLRCPVYLELVFYMPRPKSHFRPKDGAVRPSAPQHHIVMPDAGKLARGTTDACKGILWRDDSQVIEELHKKAYTTGQPGCWITVRWL